MFQGDGDWTHRAYNTAQTPPPANESAKTPAESRQFVAQAGREAVAEDGEVLLDEGEFGLPIRDVDAQKLVISAAGISKPSVGMAVGPGR